MAATAKDSQGVRLPHAQGLKRLQNTCFYKNEIGIFERGCLSRRVSSREELCSRVQALETERNTAMARICWRFTTPDARLKFARFYEKLLQPDSDSPKNNCN